MRSLGTSILLLLAAVGLLLSAQSMDRQQDREGLYILGPDDQVTIHVLDMDEIGAAPYRIDLRGNLNLPVVGRVQAGGLTVEQFEAEITRGLKSYLKEPTVTVFVTEFRSQPVSVLGAVQTPGVLQIHGKKTLFEVLSAAGGLKPDAGNTINLTRRKEAGPIPLPTARLDGTGEFYVAELKVKSVMEATNPQENIVIVPNDVISVPKGDLVYVIGAVNRSGGFILNEKENISVLEALSLAEGLGRGSAPGSAKILRPSADRAARTEIPVDLKKILAGKSPDVPLAANDILFVPTSAPKNAALRGVEAAISIGTGLAIYRP